MTAGLRPIQQKNPMPEWMQKMDAYWRAANYLSVGQIYLLDNPLLQTPLHLSHVKPRLLGHWGTTPGLNFIYVHLNRIITEQDQDMILITGPGHGGPALVAQTYLEGSYTERYPEVTRDAPGLKKLFRQFSFPGGIPSHAAPETPGSIHEGGELGYCLAHAYGAAFDHPDLLVACVVGDGEAETGPLATGWHSNKFLNPIRDGAVLPILHLNGYKIAGPTVLARMSRQELRSLFLGYGYRPYFVEGEDPCFMHQKMAATLDEVTAIIRQIQNEARRKKKFSRPRWPMIILVSPKGWTGPKQVDGKAIEGTFRAHQVPVTDFRDHPHHLQILETWMKSYHPEMLFDSAGCPKADWADIAPKGERRLGANPHANGGLLLKDLHLPDFHHYALQVPYPGAIQAEATRVQGTYIRDVMQLNMESANFRVFSPDETASNRWNALFEVTDRCSVATLLPGDEHVAQDGRVMEMLS
ncbi:MAG: phosphoketolase family protein, partial [Pseudomonadota bacterium]|nr:phosphoketolase family protein [Pseudomonadota bacterium]